MTASVPRRGRANSGGGGRCAGCLLDQDQQTALDAGLVARVPIRTLAARFGISKSSIARHRPHVSTGLATLHGAVSIIPISPGPVGSSDDVASEARRLYGLCRGFLEQAVEGGNVLQVSLAAREARGSLELLGRQLERLESRRVVGVVDVQRSQEWVEIRAVVLEFVPHERRQEFSRRLLLLEKPNPNGHDEPTTTSTEED